MTTIEHTPDRARLNSERPVFLAENGRRARILGIAAKIAVLVTVLWLAALAAGMLGFGHLPGTSIEQPFNRLISGGEDASKNQAPSTDSASAATTASARERAVRAQAIVARHSTPVRRPRSRRPAPAQPTQPAQPAPGQAAVSQQPRQQGWTRRGYVTPPGQVRKAQPPAPVPTQPGKALGRVKKTTPITPPPPPPPPPGNGNGNGSPKLK
jgi:hypothetical protein